MLLFAVIHGNSLYKSVSVGRGAMRGSAALVYSDRGRRTESSARPAARPCLARRWLPAASAAIDDAVGGGGPEQTNINNIFKIF